MKLDLDPLEVGQIMVALQGTSNLCQLIMNKIQAQAAPPAATGPGITEAQEQTE
jgi:hypothetical protein